MPLSALEQTVLAALDEQGLVESCRALLRFPSVTGLEAEAQQWMGRLMRQIGLAVDLWTIDVAALQRHPRFPGMEVDRGGSAALGLVGMWTAGGEPGASPARRLVLNGHIDVVPPGDLANWRHDPWGAELVDGRIYGRGACDMKGGLTAALYAVKALKDAGAPVKGTLMLQSVIGEEDGGLGTFAALQRGHRGDAAIVCEPTQLKLVPAHAGALTFTVRVPGKSAHASVRLAGVSAVEKYLDIHRALLRLEGERNRVVEHPLLRKLPLPYPLSIGRVQAGNWSSSVPEELLFVGRIGVAMGEPVAAARAQFERTLQQLADADSWLREHPPQISWSGGQFEAGEIALDHPLLALCKECACDLSGQQAEVVGAPYGSDLRLLVNEGHIPAVLFGPGDVDLAHMPDEYVRVAELIQAARAYILLALRYLV